jgi:hypothetical protein
MANIRGWLSGAETGGSPRTLAITASYDLLGGVPGTRIYPCLHLTYLLCFGFTFFLFVFAHDLILLGLPLTYPLLCFDPCFLYYKCDANSEKQAWLRAVLSRPCSAPPAARPCCLRLRAPCRGCTNRLPRGRRRLWRSLYI